MSRFRLPLAARRGLDGEGERFVPEHRPDDVALEHLHRYILAASIAQGQRVLDVACGEGYGSHLLSQVGARVVGLDRDERTVRHARDLYGSSAQFVVGDAVALPFPDAAFDLLISFETIEHLSSPDTFLDELRRVLRPGGALICSTPDRDVYRATRGGVPNPHHLREMTSAEFAASLNVRFREVRLYGQEICYGSQIWPLGSGEDDGRQESIVSNAALTEFEAGAGRMPTYVVALASAGPLRRPSASTLSLRELRNPISALLGGIAERDREILRLRAALEGTSPDDWEKMRR